MFCVQYQIQNSVCINSSKDFVFEGIELLVSKSFVISTDKYPYPFLAQDVYTKTRKRFPNIKIVNFFSSIFAADIKGKTFLFSCEEFVEITPKTRKRFSYVNKMLSYPTRIYRVALRRSKAQGMFNVFSIPSIHNTLRILYLIHCKISSSCNLNPKRQRGVSLLQMNLPIVIQIKRMHKFKFNGYLNVISFIYNESVC